MCGFGALLWRELVWKSTEDVCLLRVSLDRAIIRQGMLATLVFMSARSCGGVQPHKQPACHSRLQHLFDNLFTRICSAGALCFNLGP